MTGLRQSLGALQAFTLSVAVIAPTLAMAFNVTLAVQAAGRAAPLAFLVLVLQPAYEFASDEVFVSTPALDISNGWRAAALPVGIALALGRRASIPLIRIF